MSRSFFYTLKFGVVATSLLIGAANVYTMVEVRDGRCDRKEVSPHARPPRRLATEAAAGRLALVTGRLVPPGPTARLNSLDRRRLLTH